MLLKEARMILQEAGYRLVEDTDTLEHEIEHQNAEYAKQYNVDGNAWNAGDKLDRLNKKAREGSLKSKIDNAKKFNGGAAADEEPMMSNTPEGVIAVLKGMGIDIDDDEFDIYEEDNIAYIRPHLGNGKWKNNLCYIECHITFTNLKRGTMRIDLDVRKSGFMSGSSRVSIPVDSVSKTVNSAAKLKPIILNYVRDVVAAGFKADPNDYYSRKGELKTWQKLVKKFNLSEAYDAVTAHRKANGDATYSGKFTTRLCGYLKENGIKAKLKPNASYALELNDGDYTVELVWNDDAVRSTEGSKGDRAAHDNSEYSFHENKVGLQFFVADDLDATESKEFDIRNLPSMLSWIEDCMERYDSENEDSDIIDIIHRLQEMFDVDYGGSKALKNYSVMGGDVDDGVGNIHITKTLRHSYYEIEVNVSKSKRGYEISINWENVDTEVKYTKSWTEDDVRDAVYNIGAYIRNELK